MPDCRRIMLSLLTLALAMAAAPAPTFAEVEPLPETIRFNRDIAPILSNTCFKCHGFDEKERKASLRLDTRAGLTRVHEGVMPIVPGDLTKSEVYRRIVTDDADDLMPPADSGKKLTQRQKDLFKRWIEQGMDWEGHWSFTPVERPELPKVSDARWVRNPIDAFVLARLEKDGLKPSPQADKITLIRRLSLDLTGLPPTPAEVDGFASDTSPDAYEKLVDRLLASPRYGERMAVDWLDAARYADTNGYHIDNGRDMTRWRDYVINAFNANMPFDVFTTEQLAGDLLPGTTTEQRIASGFNRNHMINFENGAIPEEYQTAYVLDRTNTTGTVWLGLTVACTQCHDHKFDPITQQDYYSLYAFFNNVEEKGLDGEDGNAVPYLKTPTPEQQLEIDRLAIAVKDEEQKIAAPMAEVDAAQADWEKTALAGHVYWTSLVPAETTSAGGATFTPQNDQSVLVGGANNDVDTYAVVVKSNLKDITAIRVEALPDDSLPAKGPGRSGNGNYLLTDARLAIGKPPAAASRAAVKRASVDFGQEGSLAEHVVDGQPTATGWGISPQVGKPHDVVFELAEPANAEGAEIALNLTLVFQGPFAQHQIGRFRVSVTDAKNPHARDGMPPSVAEALAAAPEQRSDAQKASILSHYRGHVSPAVGALNEQLAAARKAFDDGSAKTPTAMVMQEMATPRETHVHVRGAYDEMGERVSMRTPSFLPPMDASWPKNRLGLARWILDDGNPLTSRVTVNRFWQSFFGTGLVKTSDDFGSQGEVPSHPELLDWLAAEFMHDAAGGRWDVKRIVKLLVTSAAYRQSSTFAPGAFEHDPENRLLARGSRFRLQAEFVRDQALAASGLLDGRIGGASVSPYQPAGLWEEIASRQDSTRWTAQRYTPSTGADLYRRSMYTFWKRTSPPPQLSTFDAPDRETCTVRRSRTNTPLQALVLLNDPTYVEAARKLAERVMKEGGPTPEDRIAYAFRLPLSRRAKPEEAAVLRRIFDAQLAHFRANPGAAAAAQLLAVGESPRDESLDVAELAAWTTVTSVILNLDETVTKG